MRRFPNLLCCAVLLASHASLALMLEPPMADVQQEAQAQQLFHAMRCVVCEGQSLADSDATFAVQMRAEIREQLARGESPATITDYFTARYGDAILMQPPLKPHTYLLWVMPFLFVLGGIIGVYRRTRHAPTTEQ